MASYSVSRNAPGRVRLVCRFPDITGLPDQEYEAADLDEAFARRMRESGTVRIDATWSHYPEPGHLGVKLGTGTIQASSANLTVTNVSGGMP